MQSAQPSLFLRDDTFFGVCEALGEDFGFNPLFLRIVFAVALIWNPIAVVAAYAGAGVVVMISRWLAPNLSQPVALEAAAASEAMPVAPEQTPSEDNDEADADALAVAA
jgi:phage shock protein C